MHVPRYLISLCSILLVIVSQCSLLFTIYSRLIGGIAAVLTQPADVIKTRMMVRTDSTTPTTATAENSSILETARSIIILEGWAGLFAGVVPRVLLVGFGGTSFENFSTCRSLKENLSCFCIFCAIYLALKPWCIFGQQQLSPKFLKSTVDNTSTGKVSLSLCSTCTHLPRLPSRLPEWYNRWSQSCKSVLLATI